MSEYLRKNPEAMLSLFFYEHIQNEKADETFPRLTKFLEIPENSHEFSRIMIEWVFEKNKIKNDRLKMANIIQNNKNAIHYCVLYEFLQKKPIGQSYKTFCNTVGKGVVDFKEFKNLFDRFARGKFAILGETCTSEIQCPNMTLPEEILVKIVEKSGLKERLTLRKVSRCFRAIVDESKLICEKIDIRFTDLFTEICYESLPMINYQQKNEGCLIDFGGNRTIMNGERHIECALRDLNTILKNPKFELRVLKTTFLLGIPFLFNGYIPTEWTPIYRFMELEDFFQRFKRRLHVKSFDIQFEVHWNDDTEPILSILPHLKPGILEKIRIKMDVDFSDQMKEVVKLEQWKQAIELDMRKTHFEIPLENLTHFKRFSVFIPKITEGQVISIKEVITLFKSTNFESCTLNYYEDELDLDYIQSIVGPHIQDNNTGALLFKGQETKTVFEIHVTGLRSQVNPSFPFSSFKPLKHYFEMSQLLLSDRTALLTCILYDTLAKVPVYESYQKLCKIRGNYDIDYVDFEFHYYRFYNGDSNLDCDRSSSPVPLSFSTLPVDALLQILQRIDFIDKLKMRNVSKDLRDIIDNKKIKCKEMSVLLKPDRVRIGLENQSMSYIFQVNGGGFIKKYEISVDNEYEVVESKKKFHEGNFLEMAMTDISVIVSNQNLEFKKLVIVQDYAQDAVNRFIQILTSLDFQIHVEKCIFYGLRDENTLRILSCLDPDALKCLELRNNLLKQPNFEVCSLKCQSTTDYPIRHAFVEGDDPFNVVLGNEENDDNAFRCDLQTIDRVMSQCSEYDTATHRYHIPDSQEYFQFECISEECVNIWKSSADIEENWMIF
ncbi:hypothetical protein CRE_28999 [Caenorhabditis remanei]|uniref:F-box domain-containing protein n=1 Tax=Caenorhabditis remanei TaxID=31234 RepID=E3N5F2_CAERE|nr:hypothetical protein CRE_28999 [Caenorhabditis remanei]